MKMISFPFPGFNTCYLPNGCTHGKIINWDANWESSWNTFDWYTLFKTLLILGIYIFSFPCPHYINTLCFKSFFIWMCLHVSRYIFLIHLCSSAVMYRTKKKKTFQGRRQDWFVLQIFSVFYLFHMSPTFFCTFGVFYNLPSKLEKSELQNAAFIYEAHKEMGKTKYNWAI